MRRNSWSLLFLLAAGFAGPGRVNGTSGPLLSSVQRGQQEAIRDPFRAPEAGSTTSRPPGLAGVGVTEAVIRGIVRHRVPPGANARPAASGWAILESRSGEGFVAAPGDRLLDGVLGRIEEGGVVFWLDGDPDRPVHRPLARLAGPEEEQ